MKPQALSLESLAKKTATLTPQNPRTLKLAAAHLKPPN
jgi:hypothetical protein